MDVVERLPGGAECGLQSPLSLSSRPAPTALGLPEPQFPHLQTDVMAGPRPQGCADAVGPCTQSPKADAGPVSAL